MENKKIYVVIRIYEEYAFKTMRKHFHIYTARSSNKEKMMELAKQKKKTFPHDIVGIMEENRAEELQHKCYAYYNELERINLGVQKRISMAELEKKLDDTFLKKIVFDSFKNETYR